MFAAIEEKLIVGAVGAIALACASGWLMHFGAKECHADQAATVATAEVKNAKVEAAATVNESHEDAKREKDLGTAPAPQPQLSVQPAPDARRSRAAAAAGPTPGSCASESPVRDGGEECLVRASEGAAVLNAINRYGESCLRIGHHANVEVADRNRLLEIRDAEARGKIAPAQ